MKNTFSLCGGTCTLCFVQHAFIATVKINENSCLFTVANIKIRIIYAHRDLLYSLTGRQNNFPTVQRIHFFNPPYIINQRFLTSGTHTNALATSTLHSHI